MKRKTNFFPSTATNDTAYGISVELQKTLKTYLHRCIQTIKGYLKARGAWLSFTIQITF